MEGLESLIVPTGSGKIARFYVALTAVTLVLTIFFFFFFFFLYK